MKTILKPREVVFDQEGYNELVDRIEFLEDLAAKKHDEVVGLKKSIETLYNNLGSVLEFSSKQFKILLIRETEVYVSTNPGMDTKPKLEVIE